MKNTKRISIFGADSESICLYTSRIFNAFGKKTILIDNSETRALTDCIPGTDMGLEKVDYRNVDFVSGKSFADMGTDYDVEIYFYGMNADEKAISESDAMYLVVDMKQSTIKKCRELLKHFSNKSLSLIIKDYVAVKISEELIKISLGFDQFTKVKQTYVLPFDETDQAYSIIAQYNNVYRFDKISSDFKELLTGVVLEICGEDINPKSFAKTLKKAERGA